MTLKVGIRIGHLIPYMESESRLKSDWKLIFIFFHRSLFCITKIICQNKSAVCDSQIQENAQNRRNSGDSNQYSVDSDQNSLEREIQVNIGSDLTDTVLIL